MPDCIASEALGLSKVALLITDIQTYMLYVSASAALRRPCCGFRDFRYRQTTSTLSERRHRQSWPRVLVRPNI